MYIYIYIHIYMHVYIYIYIYIPPSLGEYPPFSGRGGLLWEGYRGSRRCLTDTNPESYVIKFSSIRRKICMFLAEGAAGGGSHPTGSVPRPACRLRLNPFRPLNMQERIYNSTHRIYREYSLNMQAKKESGVQSCGVRTSQVQCRGPRAGRGG